MNSEQSTAVAETTTTWPPRVRFPAEAAETLAAALTRWRIEDLEDEQSQQRARDQLCHDVPQLRAVLATAAQALHHDDAVVVEALPAVDVALVIAASAMGVPTTEDNGNPGSLVWDVRQEPPPEPATSDTPAARAPTRPDALPLHTDSAHLDRPHAVAALACVEPAQEGGISVLVPIDRVVEALHVERGPRPVELLREACFPFASVSRDGQPVRYHPILDVAGERVVVRCSPLLRWGLRLAPLGPEHRAALDTFDAFLRRPELHTRLRLVANDFLVFNNRTIVHGRTEITEGGSRHLKRLKLHSFGSRA
nr:hypothetical protein [uncultured bacterium]AXL05631.1 hypothetical protein [uncultured bacterium]